MSYDPTDCPFCAGFHPREACVPNCEFCGRSSCMECGGHYCCEPCPCERSHNCDCECRAFDRCMTYAD